jgi:hypothetical protein
MKCPPDVAEVLAEILHWALVRIRGVGFSGDARRCAQEADHVHNLPALIQNYSPDLLLYYWKIERLSFVKHAQESRVFEEPWKRLESLVERECSNCAAAARLIEKAQMPEVTATV